MPCVRHALVVSYSLVVCLLLAAPLAQASQESERLVAQGERAYQAGRYEDARALFERATHDDPADPAAVYALGLALGKLGRWDASADAFGRALALQPDFPDAQEGLDIARLNTRAAAGPATLAVRPLEEAGVPPGSDEATEPGGLARKRWSVHASTGWEYDSNPQIAPGGQQIPGLTKRGSNAVVAGAGGHYDIADTARSLLRLEYDFYQTLYFEASDFNFQSHRVRATGAYALLPWLWAGAQGGYNYYLFGPHSYLNEPYVMPFVSFLEKSWGLTQAYYRLSEDTYLSTPFRGVRDGPSHVVGASQALYLGPRYVTFGYEYEADIPRSPQGSDFDERANSAYVGVGFPLPWRMSMDLMYLFRYEHYVKPNSFSDFRTHRYDAVSYISAGVSRPLMENVNLTLTYYGTIDNSNISVYQYRRSIIAAAVEFAY